MFPEYTKFPDKVRYFVRDFVLCLQHGNKTLQIPIAPSQKRDPINSVMRSATLIS